MLLVPGFGFFPQMDPQLEEAFFAPHHDFNSHVRVLPKLLHPDEAAASNSDSKHKDISRLFIADSKEGNTATGFVYVARSDAHLNRFRTDQGFQLEDTSVTYQYNHGKNRAGKERTTNYIIGTGMDALLEAWNVHFSFEALDNIVGHRIASDYQHVCQIHFPNHFKEPVPTSIFNEEFIRAAFYKEGFFRFHPLYQETITNHHLLHTVTQRYSEITNPSRNEKMCPPGSLRCHICLDGETFKANLAEGTADRGGSALPETIVAFYAVVNDDKEIECYSTSHIHTAKEKLRGIHLRPHVPIGLKLRTVGPSVCYKFCRVCSSFNPETIYTGANSAHPKLSMGRPCCDAPTEQRCAPAEYLAHKAREAEAEQASYLLVAARRQRLLQELSEEKLARAEAERKAVARHESNCGTPRPHPAVSIPTSSTHSRPSLGSSSGHSAASDARTTRGPTRNADDRRPSFSNPSKGLASDRPLPARYGDPHPKIPKHQETQNLPTSVGLPILGLFAKPYSSTPSNQTPHRSNNPYKRPYSSYK